MNKQKSTLDNAIDACRNAIAYCANPYKDIYDDPVAVREVTCPKCKKVFTDSDEIDYIDQFNVCIGCEKILLDLEEIVGSIDE